MKVKCTKTFREFYKSNIKETKDENRNPHFAGRTRQNNGENEFGFFEFFHGNGGDMKNLLKTILEMARDSQALYEFLQNAVDAKSSDFLMFHHYSDELAQDYLIVLNNGDPFSLEGVLSILDIGASTKFGDAETIGQFGVGFKLAHRLVGEDAGLEELLEENKGPILFSWQHNELRELAAPGCEIEPSDPELEGKGLNKVRCISQHPWLFKILYTNFPCLPGEAIIDARDRMIDDSFSSAEVKLLSEVACISINEKIKSSDFTHGTLLLIPLHSGKVQEVTQSANADGLPITAAILNNRKGHEHLQRVVLDKNDLEAGKVCFESFKIDVDELHKIDKDDDRKLLKGITKIEMDFCYSDPFEEVDPFRGKPQFYLYFPMTEERHGFRFALHCNVFSFTAARTALQDNTQRNRLLFNLFSDRLLSVLKQHSDGDKDRFIRIYASLLLSERGNGENKWKPNREWLEEEFWTPLMNVVRKFIPVMHGETWLLAMEGESVTVRDSALPLELWMPEGENWFYWNAKDHARLCHLATDKLSLERKDIVDVVLEASVEAINNWLELSDEHPHLFLSELNNDVLITSKSEREREKFWAQFKQLRLWQFESCRYSAEELNSVEHDDKVLLYGPLISIAPLLRKAKFDLSTLAIDSYASISDAIRSRLSGELPYLKRYEALCQRLNSGFMEPDLYTSSERREIYDSIFSAIKDGAKDAEARKPIRSLSIFTNKRGEVTGIQSLIGASEVPRMLENWRINPSDADGLNVLEYTANSHEEIYQNVIVPNWENIIQADCNEEELLELFSFVRKCYEAKPGMQVLPKHQICICADGFVSDERSFFFHRNLLDYEADEYALLENAFIKLKLGRLPSRTVLPFYMHEPFLLAPMQFPICRVDGEEVRFHLNEANALFRLARTLNHNLFNQYCFASIEEDALSVQAAMEGARIYEHPNHLVHQYVARHCHGDLIRIAGGLDDSAKVLALQGDELIKFLIEGHSEQPDALRDLVSLLTEVGGDDQKMQLLSKVNPLTLDNEILDGSLERDILCLCFSISNNDKRRKIAEEKFVVTRNDQMTTLGELESRGSDKLLLKLGDDWEETFSISTLLGGAENKVNSLLASAAAKWESFGINYAIIEETLGIKKPREASDVYRELKEQNGGLLISGVQLAFVALFSLESRNSAPLKEARVRTMAGEKTLYGSTLYLNNAAAGLFLAHDLLLPEQYDDARKFLGLHKHESYHVFETTILNHPHLHLNKLVMPGMKHIQVDEKQQAFTKYLHELWEKQKPSKICLPDDVSSWSQLIGVEVQSWITVPEVAMKVELADFSKLPESIHGDTAFLEALGSQGEGSPIVEVRKHFKKAGGSLAPQRSMDRSAVLSTLKWLSSEQLPLNNQDVVPFYEPNLHPASEPLPPLPCIKPDRDGLFIESQHDLLNVLTRADAEHARQKGIRELKLASMVKVPIIADIGCISGLFGRIESDLKKLLFNWNVPNWELLKGFASEWVEGFYIHWKETAQRPAIRLYMGSIPRADFANGIKINDFAHGDCVQDSEANIFYVNGRLGSAEIISELKKAHPAYLHGWKELEEVYIRMQDRMQMLISKANRSPQFQKRLEKMLDEIENAEERQEKAILVKDMNSRYTYQWFLNLLDLVKSQEKRVGTPDIIFARCKLVEGSAEIYELSQANRNIPIDIDTYDSIRAKVTYLNAEREIQVHNNAIEASYKSNKIWVRFLEAFPASIDPATITEVCLSFVRQVDLIEALRSGFEDLGYMETENLKANLTSNIDFIFGPPGTGKTTTLATKLIDYMRGSRERIVVLTPTNKAADVLCKKVRQLFRGIPGWLIRTGSCTDPEVLSYDIVRQGKDIFLDRPEGSVVITTIHRFSYHKVYGSRADEFMRPLSKCSWSIVVFDEASMIPLPYITYAIHQQQQISATTSFIVAGDPLQIPPVFELISDDLEDEAEDLQLQNLYTMVELDSFLPAEQEQKCGYARNNKVVNLLEQHRSIRAIGELFSQFQYGSLITHSRGTERNEKPGVPRRLPEYFSHELGFRPITVIRYPVRPGDTIYNPRKLQGSPLHLYSSFLVSELVKRFRTEIEKEKLEPWSLGILSPYRGQSNLMGKMIEGHPSQSPRLKITTGTVHGFQGDENNVVFAVMNPGNSNVIYSRFLNKPYIINVAISRAEDYLVLFIPDEGSLGIEELSLVQRLLEIISSLPVEMVTEIHAQEIETKIMNKARYFEKNSMAVNHQLVNVYGVPHVPFVVRLNDNAVDIHWNQP